MPVIAASGQGNDYSGLPPLYIDSERRMWLSYEIAGVAITKPLYMFGVARLTKAGILVTVHLRCAHVRNKREET